MDLSFNNVFIQHHVTIGSTEKGVPKLSARVFVGAHTMILGNVEIGENAVIGAGCVVTKNVPANSTVVGNPMLILEKEV